MMSRRGLIRTMLATLAARSAARRGAADAAADEDRAAIGVPEQTLDFDGHSLEGWTTLSGRWAIEEMPEPQRP